jgi:succinate dehydrogenase flavin-adding protein (antitoxin of CptAB toxin-antitoxin module)
VCGWQSKLPGKPLGLPTYSRPSSVRDTRNTPLPDDAQPYGARLYAELKRLDILVSKFTYEKIERLKRANRDETIRFFRASDDDVLQQIRTREPEDVVQYVMEKANRARQADLACVMPFLSG